MAVHRLYIPQPGQISDRKRSHPDWERLLRLRKDVDGAAPYAELNTFVVGIEKEVDTVPLDAAAAVLSGGHTVCDRAIGGDDIHTGAIGNHFGVHGDSAHAGGGAGGGSFPGLPVRGDSTGDRRNRALWR